VVDNTSTRDLRQKPYQVANFGEGIDLMEHYRKDSITPQWLAWVQHLQAITQNGLTFATDPFDIARYESVRDIAAEIAATCSQTPIEPIRALFTQETGYVTPKIDVRGAVFRDGGILLVKERSDGLWTLPGGWADVNESPDTALPHPRHASAGAAALRTRTAS
jgi:Hydrolase of X-linked nucleoside diphosphate N terminal